MGTQSLQTEIRNATCYEWDVLCQVCVIKELTPTVSAHDCDQAPGTR